MKKMMRLIRTIQMISLRGKAWHNDSARQLQLCLVLAFIKYSVTMMRSITYLKHNPNSWILYVKGHDFPKLLGFLNRLSGHLGFVSIYPNDSFSHCQLELLDNSLKPGQLLGFLVSHMGPFQSRLIGAFNHKWYHAMVLNQSYA